MPSESGLKSAFFGGFSGTGETIVKDAFKMNSSFSQKWPTFLVIY